MSGGTFNVSRGMWDHPVFTPSKFSDREAFLWLISEASWKDRTIRSGCLVAEIKRGQVFHSIRFMSDKWGWSRSSVDRFLKKLIKWDMIRADSGTGQNLVTICSYDKYQSTPKSGGTQSGTPNVNSAGHGRDKEEEGLNKVNKVNSINFDVFWSSWPNKVSKPAAKKIWDRLPNVDREAIISLRDSGFANWRSSAPTANPIHAATFLNNRRWEDTPSGSNVNGARSKAEMYRNMK